MPKCNPSGEPHRPEIFSPLFDFMARRKIVVTEYREEHADILRLFVRSWEARGWAVRLVFPDETPTFKFALRANTCYINFGFRPGDDGPYIIQCKQYRTSGWEKSPIVLFPDANEDTVLHCGRSLK